jgi:peptide-methionine (S)-S-oxide reductase
MRSFDMRLPFLALALATTIGCSAIGHAEKAVVIPAAALDQKAEQRSETAVFAGGCFWGMEGVFEHVKGVQSVTSGYAGGSAATATYDDVTTETTGHAESIRVTFNPAQISYGKLLQIYFAVAHDPTQLNRQGPDSGPSYRSAIFPQTPDQATIARAYIAQLTKARSFSRPIVTKIESGKFYPAEAYHQDFMRRNPGHGYIQRFDVPKLAAFKAAFPSVAR